MGILIRDLGALDGPCLLLQGQPASRRVREDEKSRLDRRPFPGT